MKKIVLLVIAIAMLVAACGADADSAATTSTTTPTTTVVDDATDGGSKASGDDAKLSSHLVDAADLAAAGVAVDGIAEQVPVLQFADGLILIEITYDAVTPDRVAAAEAAGLVISGEYADLLLITGSAAPEDLRAIAALDGVEMIQPSFGATTNR